MPLKIIPVIKKPEITKKISTPANPPGAHAGSKWNSITAITAIALNPFMSSLKFNEGLNYSISVYYFSIEIDSNNRLKTRIVKLRKGVSLFS